MATTKPVPNPHRPNIWGMLRDIIIASINKGQLLLLMTGLLLALMIWKMPSEDVSKLFFAIMNEFKSFYFLGWFLSALLIVAWTFSGRVTNRGYKRELGRMNAEIERLHSQLVTKK